MGGVVSCSHPLAWVLQVRGRNLQMDDEWPADEPFQQGSDTEVSGSVRSLLFCSKSCMTVEVVPNNSMLECVVLLHFAICGFPHLDVSILPIRLPDNTRLPSHLYSLQSRHALSQRSRGRRRRRRNSFEEKKSDQLPYQ